MDDPSLARVPVAVASADAVGVKATPRCSVCGTPVSDLTDPKQHVCVPDPVGAVVTAAGSFTKTTLDKSTASWEKTEAEFRAAEAAAAAKAPPVAP